MYNHVQPCTTVYSHARRKSWEEKSYTKKILDHRRKYLTYDGRDAIMGGRGSNSRIARQVPQGAPTPIPQTDNSKFSDTDSAPFHDLYNGRQYYQDQDFGIDTRMALVDYLQNQPTTGSLYSPSQQLNHAMRQGSALTANQQFMVDALTDGMHNLGYNLNLTRYDRVDFIKNLGVSNFSNMPISQIQQALVGKTYTDKAFVSTSYNNFKNAPPGNSFTDKAVKINIKAPASTQALMPGNGPGGQLGEVVLAPNQTYEITGVRFTGKQGRSGSRYYKQIELDVTVK